MSLWPTGERETSDIERARNYAAKFRMATTEYNYVSIHAFDKYGLFSHVID
jgi:hypothetical protein